ncbi:MAG: DUF72 domain-containing protein [Cytophagales bacterium]|nr:DUF72 domain-containing protein [Bernardetiaceae bacterium]MDW8211487.1 DUF72 domain-containing protein [Cytophagales bacterium]
MDFGKLDDISGVDFTLPPDRTNWSNLPPRQGQVQVYVGCPVWACKEWVGSLYPPHARAKDYLYYYSRQFNAIELNSTHYHIPDNATISRWIEVTPSSFRFCPKILQEISHRLMLRPSKEVIQTFCKPIAALGNRLGMAFLQLPPSFAPAQLPVLAAFLKDFPREIPLAVEFRHPAWFQGPAGYQPFDHAAALLEQQNISTVICDVAGRRDVLHQRLTTGKTLIRFVGNGLHPSDYTRIDAWVERLKEWIDKGVEQVYFFVHEPNNALAPQLANYLINKLNERVGTSLRPLQKSNVDPQMHLF